MLYRVDKRIFKKGEIIKSNTTFVNILNEEKKEMEEMLNIKRPDGIPERRKCLFLFRDLICALQFQVKFGGNIYGVSVSGEKYFRGDMNKLDNILDVFRFTDDYYLREAVVNEYWKEGTHTFNPCYEILVSSACVKKIIDDSSLCELKSEINDYGSIENTPTYKSLIQSTNQKK